jgi:ATP-dependent DNA helicase DinG
VRLSIDQIAPSSPFFEALDTLKASMSDMIAVLEKQAERAETIEQCRARAIMLQDQIDDWNAEPKGKEKEGDYVYGSKLFLFRYNCIAHRCRLHRYSISSVKVFPAPGYSPRRRWR